MAKEVKRINMNMPVETLKRVDEYADSMTISRTSAILVLLNQALDSKQAISDFSKIVEVAKMQGIEI